MSGKPLRILIIEDSEEDAELEVLSLRRAGWVPEWRRADSAESLRQALSLMDWNVILSDFRMPRFNAFDALAILRETGKSLPFIVVSGAIGEEIATQLMRQGAHNYVAKDHLHRLPSVVEREIEDAEIRKEKSQAKEALRVSLERMQTLSRAGQLLSESLDYEQTLARLADLVVQGETDWCNVDVIDEDGRQFSRIAVGVRDSSQESLASRIKEEYARFDPRSGGFIDQVRKSRRPVFLPFVDETVLRQGLTGSVIFEASRGKLPASLMYVPLIARNRLLGVLSFVRFGKDRPYDEEDLKYAEELCSRAALAIDNARLYGEAQRAIQIREDVVAIVSHDLKSPLSTVLMSTRLQKLSLESPSSAERDMQLLRQTLLIERAANQMNRLISDLLDLARIRGKHLSLEVKEHSALALLQETREMFQLMASEKGIDLEVVSDGDDFFVECDHDRMIQVFSNLVGNAIKFSPPGRRVVLSFGLIGDRILFFVRDNGPGIPEADRTRVFHSFWQASHTSRKAKGAGLGLAIARGVVEAHGGKIWVESHLGEGSTFFVELPKVFAAKKPAA